jgi:hypothetical protein
VAGAVRAEARVIMATREASLGASARHLKRHHERRRGVTVVHTAGTQRSVQLPSGAIRLRISSTRSPVRTSGGRSGRGRPRGGTSANSRGRTALSDMAVGTRVLYNCAYSTTLDRNTTANRNGHAMPHTTETAKRTPTRLSRRGARRGRPRVGNKLPVQQKSRLPHPLALPVAGCPRTSHSLRAARRSAISAYPTVLRGLRPPTRTVNDRRPTCGPNHRTNAPVTASRSTAAPPTVAPNCRDANMNAAPPCLQPPHLHRGANGGRRCMASVY